MRRVLLILLGLLMACPASAQAPWRVVSFNLCADQLVVALADPEQIAGLSPYAADPNLSVVADKARAFRPILPARASKSRTCRRRLAIPGAASD